MILGYNRIYVLLDIKELEKLIRRIQQANKVCYDVTFTQ